MREKLLRTILLVVLLYSFLGCGKSYHYKDRDQLDFLTRIQTQRLGEVEVSAVALASEETLQLFGVEAEEEGIQPVWLRVRNNDDFPYWLFLVKTDPEYYSPHEASWINHFSFSADANRKMDGNFRRKRVYYFVKAGHTITGFVFTRLDEGRKPITVELKSPGQEGKTFFFSLPVPGMLIDRDHVDLAGVFGEDQIIEIKDFDALRTWIEQLPCCVFGDDGISQADPLNLVLIGYEKDVEAAFTQRNWHVTEKLNLASIWKTIKAFLSGSKYRYSPVSPLYVFGRQQDYALQKVRETIDERNHLRIWLAPVRFQGRPVWVGQISRDIGVRMTGKFSPLTTHVIDPEVDEARYYLSQDLLLSQRVYRGALAAGVGTAFPEEPRQNLLGDPYYTDGLRLVLFIGNKPMSFIDIEFLKWESQFQLIYLQSDDGD